MKLFNLSRYVQCDKRLVSRAATNAFAYKPGQTMHGYEVRKAVEIPEFSMTAIELEHRKTGSHHLHIARDDSNNVFNVAFRTTPMNGTGVAHVLEHVALSGSNKYPVRDPFFKMLNRSMCNFMNALTGSDYTMYPFSTQHGQVIRGVKSSKDFSNLMSVYLDATFFPRIRKMTFLQEGWRLEHEKVDDRSSPIIFKGVVFNEMKGMASDSSYLYGTSLLNNLMPDHTYGVCSGGDPAHIPDLTWDDLKSFHASHYHPSNARFITYGDIPLENHLKQINEQVMENFDRIDPGTEVPMQKAWTKPRNSSISCPPDVMAANPDKQTTFSYSYILPEVANVYESFVASVLCTLLTDGPASPFYKSLIESGIGADYSPSTGYHGHMKQAAFSVGLQGIDDNNVDKVAKIIEDTFDDVIKNGFSNERVEALLHRIELQTKHQSSKFGLGLTFNIIPVWQHGADPIKSLQVDEMVTKFKQQLKNNPKFLQEKCDEYFKKNQHRLSLTMSPDEKYQANVKENEEQNLKELVNKLNDVDKELIYKQGTELLENQHIQEDMSCLPTLHVKDIPKRQENYEVNSGVWLLMHNPHMIVTSKQPTNGINYFNNIIPIDELPEDLKPFVPLFCSILTQMGTKSTDYIKFSQKEDLFTGGMNASVTSSCHHNPMCSETYVSLESHCLERNTKEMFDLWQELFHELDLSDGNRLHTLIRQNAQELANGITYHGHFFAMRSAAQQLTPSSAYEEQFSGLVQVELMKKLAEKEDVSDIQIKLNKIADFVLRKHAITHACEYNGRSMLHAMPKTMNSATQLLDQFVQEKPNRKANEKNTGGLVENELLEYLEPIPGSPCRLVKWNKFHETSLTNQKLFHKLPIHVNYASMCVSTEATYVTNECAAMRVLAKLLTTQYLHREIREKGGAYGGGAKHGLDGIFRFFSYRDPNNRRTLDTFTDSLNWVSDGEFSQEDIDEAKLSVFQMVDAPVSPSSRGMDYFLHGLTDETRQKHRNNLLQVDKDQLLEAAKIVQASTSSGITVIGPSDEQLQESDQWQVCA